MFLVQFVIGVGGDLTRTGKEHPNQAFLPCSLEITKLPLGPNPGPENEYRGPSVVATHERTPCWHGAMEGVGYRS